MGTKIPLPTSDGPVPLKRGDLRGLALGVYIPRRGRGHRHYEGGDDSFSVALWLAKINAVLPCGEGAGVAYAPVWGPQIAALVPEGVQAIVYPPAGRKRVGRFYLAEALARQVAAALGVPCLGCLSWAVEGAEASKSIMHQTGKGRALARRAVCSVRLDHMRIALVDDIATTLVTGQRCAEALQDAGAEVVGIYTLAATEATRDRPHEERERIQARAERRRLRAG